MTRALLILSLLLVACGSDPEPAPEATPEPVVEPTPEPTPEPEPEPTPPPEVPAPRTVSASDTLGTGTAATGRAGDWLLQTGDGRVRFVVGDVEHRVGFAESGGNLLDILVGDDADQFDGMSTWLEREFPRQGRYTEQAVEDRALVVSGADSGNTAVAVSTRWEVERDAPDGVWAVLQVTTTVSNGTGAALADYDLGDIIAWGGLRHFAPPHGFGLKGTSDAVPWIGAEGPDHAVLVVGDGELDGPHGSSWSDPVYAAPTIAAGEAATYTRRVLVGRTMAELVSSTVREGRTVTLQARDPQGAAIANTTLQLTDPAGAPYVVGKTNADGDLALTLPARPLRATLQAPARTAGPAVDIAAEGDVTVTVTASGAGSVRATILDSATAAAMPGRLRFFGRNGTPTPVLGPDSAAIGGDRANLLGETLIPVPPGDYRVVATRGPAWSLAEAKITVPEGGEAAARLTLTRVIPTDGWLQCDLHTHSAWSADSTVPPRDALTASVAEGLDCIATTEHDVVADWTADIAATGLTDELLWLAGLEVTSSDNGHYNVYPWAPELGVLEHRRKGPFEITAMIRERAPGAVLHVNHPRWGRIGVFNAIEHDELRADLDYDVLEILNGKNVDDAEAILLDVVGNLNAGNTATMAGVSDSHRLVGQERGVGRSWVHVGAGVAATDARDAAVHALKRTRRVAASTGPLLDARYADEHIEITLMAPEWMPVDSIALYAGDFGGGDGAPATEITPAATFPAWGEVVDGLRTVTIRQRVVDPAAGAAKGKRWYLVVARSETNMEPWMDAPAWAMSSPIVWQPFKD
mgnify:CR=1 FL=1